MDFGPRAGDGEGRSPRSRIASDSRGVPLMYQRHGWFRRWTGEPDPCPRAWVLGQPGLPRSKRVGPLSSVPDQVRDDPRIRRRDVDRSEKHEFVAGLHEMLAATSMIVVTHNQGLTVAEATDLEAPDAGGRRDLQGHEEPPDPPRPGGDPIRRAQTDAEGPTALAWSQDPVAAAKATVEFARTNDKLQLIGGALGRRCWTRRGCGRRGTAEPGCVARTHRGYDRHPRDARRRRPAGLGRAARTGLRRFCQTGRGAGSMTGVT